MRGWRLDTAMANAPPAVAMPLPEAPAAELRHILDEHSGRVLEVVRYTVDPADRDAFLAAMKEARRVRLRSGAVAWRSSARRRFYFRTRWQTTLPSDVLRQRRTRLNMWRVWPAYMMTFCVCRRATKRKSGSAASCCPAGKSSVSRLPARCC